MKLLIIFLVFSSAVAVAMANPLDREIHSRNLFVDPIGRIANGQTAAAGQIPYQVALVIKLNWFQSAFCGASMISPEWVLTAAHCADGARWITAYFGSTDRTRGEQIRTIGKSDIHIHPKLEPKTIHNDIALLKVSSVPLSEYIKTIKLPSLATNYYSYENEQVLISGWGYMGDSNKTPAKYLQFGRVEIVSNGICEKVYGTESVTAATICIATPKFVSPCQGDSGGPLVLESGDKVQIGVVSYGSARGCEQGYPVVFTRVTSFLDWINKTSGVSY